MTGHSYDGPPLDATYQHISDAPAWRSDDGETVNVVDDEETGEISTENVPQPPQTPDERRPDADGQTTLDDFGWST
jgi:hypothetical protein